MTPTPTSGAADRPEALRRSTAADGKTELFNLPGYPLMVRAVDFNRVHAESEMRRAALLDEMQKAALAAGQATAAQGFRDGVASLSANAGEPVAWQVWWGLGEMRPHWPPFKTQNDAADHASMIKSRTEVRPLYAAPPTAQSEGWRPPELEWDEVFDCAVAAYCRSSTSHDALRLCFQSRNQQHQISCGWTANELMDFARGIARLYSPPTSAEGV